MVAGSIAQALHHDISAMPLSRSSIRCFRKQVRVRKTIYNEPKASLSIEGPIIFYWNRKVLAAMMKQRKQ